MLPLVLFILFNNDVCVCNDSLKVFLSARGCEAVGACETVGASAAVGVFAYAGQQNLIEWLKGVRRYELSDCLRQQVLKNIKPGGAMHRAVWMEK